MKKLFGADGIRGITDQYPFRKEDQKRLGQALAQAWFRYSGKPVILLGTDTRESDQRVKEALVEGLTYSGVEVWDVGIIPTAAISYLVAGHADLHGGVMVSASHNPIIENGIKVFDERGMKISDKQETELEDVFFRLRPKNYPNGFAAHIYAQCQVLRTDISSRSSPNLARSNGVHIKFWLIVPMEQPITVPQGF